jgi:hypothetical protein
MKGGTSGTPGRISAAVSLSLDVRAPLEGRAMNERGSQRRADKWTVMIWACAARCSAPVLVRGEVYFLTKGIADSERF